MIQFEHAGEDYIATVSLTVSEFLCDAFVWLHQVNERAELFDTSFTAPLPLRCCLKKSYDSRMPSRCTLWKPIPLKH